MNEIRDIRDIVVIIRDIALTIAAVLLVISMVHWDKYDKSLYLGLPISSADKDGFAVYSNSWRPIKVQHENSCVKQY